MSELRGTLRLARLVLRRDWLRLAIWSGALTLFMVVFAAAIKELVPTPDALEHFVRLYAMNPVFRLFGLASGATVGAFLMTRTHMMFALGIVLMVSFAVVRNTRREEEVGRAELVGSTAVGRYAGLVATLIVVLGATLLVALLLALVLMAQGFAVAGSFAVGASIGALGVAFAGVAAVAAQVSQTARGANGMTMAAFAVAFTLAGLGNIMGSIQEGGLVVRSGFLAWLSPLGWSQQMRPFGGDAWWVLFLFLGFSLAAFGLAFALRMRRDVGSGLLAQRAGPARAHRFLLSGFGLATRLQRGLFIGWLVAFVALAAIYGATSGEIEGLIEELGGPAQELFGGAEVLLDAFLGVVASLFGIFVTAYVLQVLLRMRSEERGGALEALLATGLSRRRWMLGHLGTALLGALLLLLAAGVTTAAVAALVLGDASHWFARLLPAFALQGPAVLVVAGVGVAAFGVVPRVATGITWGAFALFVVMGPVFGEMLGLPDAVLALSPFAHVPIMLGEGIALLPLAVMTAVALVAFAVGFAVFQRRDLALAS